MFLVRDISMRWCLLKSQYKKKENAPCWIWFLRVWKSSPAWKVFYWHLTLTHGCVHDNTHHFFLFLFSPISTLRFTVNVRLSILYNKNFSCLSLSKRKRVMWSGQCFIIPVRFTVKGIFETGGTFYCPMCICMPWILGCQLSRFFKVEDLALNANYGSQG